MNPLILIGIILLSLAIVLVLAVFLFSFLKGLKNEGRLNWKFLDYVSVGYLEHLYKKYIKRV